MFKWINRCLTSLLMLAAVNAFAINVQDPYQLVKDAVS